MFLCKVIHVLETWWVYPRYLNCILNVAHLNLPVGVESWIWSWFVHNHKHWLELSIRASSTLMGSSILFCSFELPVLTCVCRSRVLM